VRCACVRPGNILSHRRGRLARAGRAFDPRRPSSAPCSVNVVCEVIEGAGPNERRGDPEPGGKAERPGTAQRLNGDPQGPDPGNTGEGRPPRRPFLLPGLPVVPCRGNDRYPYTAAHCGAALRLPGPNVVTFGGKWPGIFRAIWRGREPVSVLLPGHGADGQRGSRCQATLSASRVWTWVVSVEAWPRRRRTTSMETPLLTSSVACAWRSLDHGFTEDPVRCHRLLDALAR
jgi:hypothetical protein